MERLITGHSLRRVVTMPGPPSVEHVVVVMLENRSFDHMLGHLDHGGLVPVTERIGNVTDVSDPDGPLCNAHFWPTDRDVSVDPGHEFADVVRQLTSDDPPLRYEAIDMGGFAWNYTRRLVELNRDPSSAC